LHYESAFSSLDFRVPSTSGKKISFSVSPEQPWGSEAKEKIYLILFFIFAPPQVLVFVNVYRHLYRISFWDTHSIPQADLIFSTPHTN